VKQVPVTFFILSDNAEILNRQVPWNAEILSMLIQFLRSLFLVNQGTDTWSVLPEKEIRKIY